MNEHPTNDPGPSTIMLGAIAVALALMVTAITCSGCSPTRQIAVSVQTTGEEIASARSDIAQARILIGSVDPPFAELDSADAHLVKAQAELAKVPALLTQTQDRTPLWATLLKWGLIVAGLGIVAFLLIYFGIGKVISPLLERLGNALKPDQQALQGEAVAKLAAGTLTPAEYTAAYRASSPANNTAYEEAKLEQKESQA